MPAKTSTKFQYGILFVAYLSLITLGLADSARGPVFPKLLAHYSLSDSAGAMFFWTASIFSVIISLFAFLWLKRLGAYRGLQFFAVLQFIALIALSYSTTYTQVIGAVAVLGISFGGMGITQNLLVAISAPPAQRRQILSGLHAMYGFAALAAPQIVSAYFAGDIFGIGANPVMGIFAWLALGTVLVIFMSMVVQAPHQKSLPRGMTFHLEGPKKRETWHFALVFSLVLALYVMAELAISTRLPLFSQRVANENFLQANWWLSGFYLALTLGRMIFAIVPIALSHRHILMISAGFALLCCAFGLYFQHSFWLALSGLGMAAFYPCMLAWMSDSRGEFAGFIASWSLAVQGFGVAIMHLIVGFLSDIWGVGFALWVAPLCLAICIFIVGRHRHFAT